MYVRSVAFLCWICAGRMYKAHSQQMHGVACIEHSALQKARLRGQPAMFSPLRALATLFLVCDEPAVGFQLMWRSSRPGNEYVCRSRDRQPSAILMTQKHSARAKAQRELSKRAMREPAWRVLQGLMNDKNLAGTPSFLKAFAKTGYGHEATWRLGHQSIGKDMNLSINIRLDRNPDEPCYRLHFYHATNSSESEGQKVCYMLFACDEQASALRGMYLQEHLRGRGLSKVLLAAWLRLCHYSKLTPRTRRMNKPLLALSLSRFGFQPVTKKRNTVRISKDKVVYVDTFFEPPEDMHALHSAVDYILHSAESSVEPVASPLHIRQALTLRCQGRDVAGGSEADHQSSPWFVDKLRKTQKFRKLMNSKYTASDDSIVEQLGDETLEPRVLSLLRNALTDKLWMQAEEAAHST